MEIEYNWHNVYVIKRPGVDKFLKKMGEIYEVVVFTASLSKVWDLQSRYIREHLLTVIYSMLTLCWTNWIFTVWWHIDCFARAATTTEETMSK